MTSKDPTVEEMEKHIVRFRDIDKYASPYRPLDMALERFDRKRYAVAGRPKELSADENALSAENAFNIAYMACEPGKGAAMHAHDTPEVFIAMSGRWAVQFGDAGDKEVVLEPWDVASVPPGVMHAIINVSEETAHVMALHGGQGGAPIRWSPSIVEEVRATGVEATEVEIPGGGKA